MARKKHKKQHSGGEAKKRKASADSPDFTRRERQERQAALADAEDDRRGNIGPSGQESHRGREHANIGSQASGRPNVARAGSHGKLNR